MADGDKKRAQRATSNVFAMFSQSQIQEYKEAFTMIDQNRDGFIDIEDLKDMYASLGMSPKDSEVKAMLDEVPGQLNFTNFLNLLNEKLHGTDPEDSIRNAFAMFDKDNKGTLPVDYTKDLLLNMGDNFTDAELKKMWTEAPVNGENFDYVAYTALIKRGKQDE